MKFTLFRRTCKEAAALLVTREDRPLSLPDSVALRLHLMACQACPQFENQLLIVRQAMAQWRQPSDAAAHPPVQTRGGSD